MRALGAHIGDLSNEPFVQFALNAQAPLLCIGVDCLCRDRSYVEWKCGSALWRYDAAALAWLLARKANQVVCIVGCRGSVGNPTGIARNIRLGFTQYQRRAANERADVRFITGAVFPEET